MPEDQTLAGGSDETPSPAQPVNLGSLTTNAVETVLDLDEVMSQARLVEKKGSICYRGDLQAEYDELQEELASLVDEHGRPLSDDDETVLSDVSRAEEINGRLMELHGELKAATRYVLFRALPDDEWQSWDRAQRDAKGDFKDVDASNTDLIARCAVEPKMTVAQVEGLRKKLGAPSIAALANAAFRACTTGGVDVPKLPRFSPSQRRDSSGRN